MADPVDQTPQDTATDTGQPAEPVTTSAPAPSYVTVEQFSTMMEQMQANFHNTLQAALSQRQAPQQQFQDDPEPTDEELDAAALEGKGVGAAVKRAVKAATNRLARQNQQEVAQVRDVGLPALAQQSLMLAKQGWEHYDKYRKEIDAAIGALPMELRAMPDNLQRVYDMVIGSHYKELQAEVRERAVREQRETDTNVRAAKVPQGDPQLDPNKLFAADDLANLAHAGKSIEHIARRLGKTPEQYLEGVRRFRERGKAA